MNYRNFARLILRKTQRLLLITILVMTYSLTSAHITEEKGGFALTLSRDCFVVSPTGTGEFSKINELLFGKMNEFTENDYSKAKHDDSSTGINFTLHSYFNEEYIDNVLNKDMGFFVAP